tara:strand:- start:4270 stop:5949 length:1680 start_codon:yes stop_codon:yes gene_type:complete
MGLFSTPQAQSVDPVELARQQVRAREQQDLIARASLTPGQTIGLLYGQAGQSLGRIAERLAGYEDPLITQARKLQQKNKNTEKAEEEAFKFADKEGVPFGTSRFFDIVGRSYKKYNLPLQGLLSYRLQNADSIQQADQKARDVELQTNDTGTRQHLAAAMKNIPSFTGLITNDSEIDFYNQQIHDNEYKIKVINLAMTHPEYPLSTSFREKLENRVSALKTSTADLKNKLAKRQTKVNTENQAYEGFTDAFNRLPMPGRLQNVTEDERKMYEAVYNNFASVRTQANMDKVTSVLEKILKEEPKTQFDRNLARILELRSKETLTESEKTELEILEKTATSGNQTINVYAEGTGTEATDRKDVRQLTQSQRSNKDLVNGVQSLLAKIQANPRTVGFLGFLGRKVAGAASSVNLPQLSDLISKGITGVGTADLKDVATRSQLLIATLTPITTGDVSGRYTDREQQIAKEVLSALEVGQGKEEVLAALRVIREVTLNDIFRNEVDLNVEQKNRLFKTNPDPKIQRDLDNELIGRLIEDYGMSENEAGNYYRQFKRLRIQYFTQ